MNKKIRIGFLDKRSRWFTSSVFLEENFYQSLSRFAEVIRIRFDDEAKINFEALKCEDLDYIYFNIMDCSFYPILNRDLSQVDIPLIFMTHTITPWILHYILIAPLIRNEDVIINLSAFAQNQLNRVLRGIRSYVVDYFIDIDSIRKNTSEISHDARTLTYLGRITERKNVHGLVRCLPEVKEAFPDFRLNIVGSLSGNRIGNEPTPYVEKLKRMVKERNLQENVNFLGAVSDDEKFRLLKKSRILVHPTLAMEESTIVVIPEAFACGTPVICTYWAGAPEFITNGENGFLIDVKWIENNPELNEKQLAESVIKILEDDELFIRMSKNAERSSLNFDYKENIPKITSLLERKRGRGKVKSEWESIRNKKVVELKGLYNPKILDDFVKNLRFSDIKDILENHDEVRRMYYRKRFKYMSHQN